jgi:hypothetical protein
MKVSEWKCWKIVMADNDETATTNKEEKRSSRRFASGG